MTLLSRLLLLALGGLAGASAQLPSTWTEPFPPHKIAGNLYYVGSKDLAPGIAADYERCFRVLKSLSVDLFLGAHGGYYGMMAKHARLGADNANPFLDPAGYHRYVADREQAFLTELARQQAR